MVSLLKSCKPACALSPDASAAILTDRIRRARPFYFLRYGDGALECMAGMEGKTCDGEVYTEALSFLLRETWGFVSARAPQHEVFVGDWRTAGFVKQTENTKYFEQYEALLEGSEPELLHFEALLLMRETTALLDFYRAVREDPRRKVFLGPAACAGAARMLCAAHVVAPMEGPAYSRVSQELDQANADVVLYGAGMWGHIPVATWWMEDPCRRTAVNIGSAMDPLFRGFTRRQQIAPARANRFFRELLSK